MRQVSPRDVVFSFWDTRIKAIGVVLEVAETGPKPDFGNAGLNWSEEGWFVPVDYCFLAMNSSSSPRLETSYWMRGESTRAFALASFRESKTPTWITIARMSSSASSSIN